MTEKVLYIAAVWLMALVVFSLLRWMFALRPGGTGLLNLALFIVLTVGAVATLVIVLS